MKTLNKLVNRLIFWRDRFCPLCEYRDAIGNFSACYECRRGNKYKERKER